MCGNFQNCMRKVSTIYIEIFDFMKWQQMKK
jgi:hypothetical protein